MSRKLDAVIFDLDGTIVDTRPAQHLVTGKMKYFAEFHQYGVTDAQPVEWIADQARKWAERDVQLFYVSGRQEEWRYLTEKWLELHHIPIAPLLMRRIGDYRPDDLIKSELYVSQIEPDYRVIVCYDDRPRVIRMWRSKGLHVVEAGTWPSEVSD